MDRLRRRVQQLEKRSEAGGKLVSMAIADRSGQVVTIPALFAEWLAQKAQKNCAGGRYLNLTDEQHRQTHQTGERGSRHRLKTRRHQRGLVRRGAGPAGTTTRQRHCPLRRL